MNFVYITSSGGFFELLNGDMKEFNPSEYTPLSANWVQVSGPSVINIINNRIESVEPLEEIGKEWADKYNAWWKSRDEAPVPNPECEHLWINVETFTTSRTFCEKCQIEK